MKDLERALSVEQDYLEHRLNGEEPYSLLVEIQKCGFKDLEDYFKDKIVYRVKQLDFSIQETTSQNFAGTVLQLMQNQAAGLVFAPTTETCVAHGSEPYNEQYCQENSIPVYSYGAFGGNIVGSSGDLSIGINVPIVDVDPIWILERIVEKLDRYEPSIILQGNDILYNGNKIAGCAFYQTDIGCTFIIHFSFSDKIELINNICLPETINKTIGYIDFMTIDDLKREVIEWRH